MIEVTLLGTGSPTPDPNRAGPATLIRAGDQVPMQRVRDICDYRSSVQEAAATAARAGVGILILTHHVPGIAPGQEDQWRALAATEFSRQIELGDDLHRVEVHPGVCVKPGG
ncbi:ribonuclease BN (tRNA processing enzyme) [Mycobacterium sp. MAA66]